MIFQTNKIRIKLEDLDITIRTTKIVASSLSVDITFNSPFLLRNFEQLKAAKEKKTRYSNKMMKPCLVKITNRNFLNENGLTCLLIYIFSATIVLCLDV